MGGGTVLASLWAHLLSCLETAGWAGALGEDVGSPEGKHIRGLNSFGETVLTPNPALGTAFGTLAGLSCRVSLACL